MAIMPTVGMIRCVDLSCVQPHNCLDNYCQDGHGHGVDTQTGEAWGLSRFHEGCAKLTKPIEIKAINFTRKHRDYVPKKKQINKYPIKRSQDKTRPLYCLQRMRSDKVSNMAHVSNTSKRLTEHHRPTPTYAYTNSTEESTSKSWWQM